VNSEVIISSSQADSKGLQINSINDWTNFLANHYSVPQNHSRPLSVVVQTAEIPAPPPLPIVELHTFGGISLSALLETIMRPLSSEEVWSVAYEVICLLSALHLKKQSYGLIQPSAIIFSYDSKITLDTSAKFVTITENFLPPDCTTASSTKSVASDVSSLKHRWWNEY
jgi:serine/threonine protein kinase